MEKTLEISRPKSFEGFDFKEFIRGFKKPAIMLLTVAITTIASTPSLAPVIAGLGGAGVIVERLWALLEFYLKEVEL